MSLFAQRMSDQVGQLVEEPLGPVDVGLGVGRENHDSNSSVKTDMAGEKKENTFYDQRTEMSREGIQKEDSEEITDPLENVIPVEKLRNGAANAMEFLNWGMSSLKEQAEKVQETEGFKKLEEATQSVRERAASALEATKPKLNEIGQAVSEKASNIYETAKPTLDEISTNAQQTFESAKESVVKTTEACKPSVQRAAESANQGLNSAYTETKSFIDKFTKD